ncbi:MAG: Wzz/FepE/Etk N-terminal domain-containing protein [Clostridia bacterium]|nr:Wzz/FepE/Etk N-terminal domain-containing protein [Clostridia bacterium]
MEELDLKELFSIFWRKKIIILIIVAIFIVIGTVYTYTIVEPKYESYTTLVLKQISKTRK